MTFLDDALKRGLREGLKPNTAGFQSIQGQKMSKDLYQVRLAEQMLEESQRIRVAAERLAMKFTIEGTHIPFDKVFQNKDVLAGQQNIEYYRYNVPPKYAFLVNRISTNWFADTFWELEIDGDVFEKGLRIIGSPASSPSNNPVEVDPPFIVNHYIQWKATNNGNTDRNFGAVSSGLIVPKTHAILMGGTKARTG